MGRQEKWNRLIDAFSGKGTAFSMPEYPKVPFPEMIEKLGALTEEDWGKYAFSREPLEGRFSNEQKMRYTHKANDCGREWAEKIARQYGTRNPGELAEKLGMKVKTPKVPVGGGLVLFAQFVEPDEITIFTDCVDTFKSRSFPANAIAAISERQEIIDLLENGFLQSSTLSVLV